MAKRNKIKYTDGGLYSPYQVLSAANAYYALSAALTDSLTDTSKEGRRLDIDMDAIAASATNRLLALELYFKALLVGLPVPVAWDHV